MLLLHLRWNIQLVMLLDAVFLNSLYHIGPREKTRAIPHSFIDPVTTNLLAGIVLIMPLKNNIRKKETQVHDGVHR